VREGRAGAPAGPELRPRIVLDVRATLQSAAMMAVRLARTLCVAMGFVPTNGCRPDSTPATAVSVASASASSSPRAVTVASAPSSPGAATVANAPSIPSAATVASAPSSPAAASPPAVAPDGLLAEGSQAPAFEATAQTGQRVALADLKGKVVVVYFYPKDDTPGCTKEACELRDAWTDLQKTGAVVIGISTNDQASHVAFAQKYKLPFLLLSDQDERIAKAFGVPVHFGFAKRVTFIIDTQGRIAKVFPNVTPTGHAAQILAAVSPVR
jgi:peroxiredoxin Q/BCP